MGYLYDKELVAEIVEQIISAVTSAQKRCRYAKSPDDFIETETGQEKLDFVCMKLIATGESLKRIDHITERSLLRQYPEVEWKKIKGIRDFLSHHYFDLDADVIFDICQEHIDTLLITLKRIHKDLLS